jgi:hypothetical protein
MKPRAGVMTVGAARSGSRPVTVEFDAGDQDPVEIYEAFERMLAAWPDARVPLKHGAANGTVCGCGTDHGGWTCSHCTKERTAMDFSDALVALKGGARIARLGWNAAGQYVVFQPGYPDGIGINANTAKATGIPQGTVKRFRPYLMLHTAQGDFVPWAPSVSDVLADDWSRVLAG